MTTVLFVHGTGVRKAAYDAAFDRFAGKLAAVRPGLTVARCYWGDECGSRLNLGGVSIPSGNSARGIGDPIEADDHDIARWALLEDDPLFELRLVGGEPAGELPPNAVPPGRRLAEAARDLSMDDTVAPLVAACGLSSVFAGAVEAVLGSEPAVLALQDAPAGELRQILARAFVAEAMAAADRELDGALALDGAHRDELVLAIVAALGGTDRGIGKFLFSVALKLGVTRPVERRRAAITNAAAPGAGDVLMYLARGGPIRAFIEKAIGQIDDQEVVIVGHSLGGIASLELLATKALPQVTMLITVGSQAPLLYELNALPTVEVGAELPASVPRWINVYDVRDLLSYSGEGVFPGRVSDRPMDNKAPFPRSHSAYFANDAFYTLLGEVVP